jgi:Leucine-rich repeat (LRR) protein
MTNMLALGVEGTGISDLSPLSGMNQLERLHLAKNNIDASGPVPLQGLTALKYLVLSENKIWDVTNLTGMTHLIDLHLWNQEWPPGLDCVQQRAIREALPSTNVFVEDFWDDPDDFPDNGPVDCNPNVVDIPFADSALEACIEAHAASQGWIKAGEVLHFVCRDMAISNIKGVEFLFNVVSVALDDNLITDITPMKDLVEITNLELFRNDISDMSPVSNMSKLNRFHIGGNSISSLEPLRHLTELVILDANDNNISSLEPVEGHSLYTWFTVAGNPITDISLIVNFPALQTLNISHTNISDISPVQDKTTLFHLDMAELQLTDADMPYLNQLTNLVRLALHMNQITDISPLQNMPDLDFIWIWQNDIVDISPLAPLQKIKVLDAGGNEIANVSALQNKPVLEWLWLPDNNVSDASPLHGLTQLDELNLREQNDHLNCEQQQNLVAALPATNVQVDGFWNDPNDDPDEGNIDCFP